MCRFITYLGKKPVLIGEILDKPSNSLINQSRRAKESATDLNADGFGIGWYNFSIDDNPGIFKSIQPAWNNNNLQNLAEKIQSTCFVGHVRACTVGDITTLNCHPFFYKNYLFVHNGTIDNFSRFKRPILNELSDTYFDIIKGQSDSEHFFALLMDCFYKIKGDHFLNDMTLAFKVAIQKLQTIRDAIGTHSCIKLNTMITNGQELLALRYTYPLEKKHLSLYYASAAYVKYDGKVLMQRIRDQAATAVVIASEPLTEISETWKKIPENHILKVDRGFNLNFEKSN